MKNKNMNYYELLEIKQEATAQEIDYAYKKAKETYNVSNSALYSVFDKDEVLNLQHLIEEAYSVLSQQEKKEEYDQFLSGKGEKPFSAESTSTSATASMEQEKSVLRDGKIHKNYDLDEEFEAKIKKLESPTGSFLQKVRKYKNISIEELSDFSKISKTNILAIEEEDIDNLPARVFTRGFAQQLARLVGLDWNAFAEGYIKNIDEKRK